MAARPLPIDIRDARLPDGRLSVSSGTSDPDVRDKCRDAILATLDTPHGKEIARRLRLTKRQPGKLTPLEVLAGVQSLNIAALVAPPSAEAKKTIRPAMLGETIDRFMRQVRSDNAAGTAESYGIVCRQLESRFGVRRDKDERIVADIPIRSVEREEAREWLKEPKKAAQNRPWSANRQTVVQAVAQQLWAMGLVEEEDQAERLGIGWKPWRNFWAADRQRPKATVRAARITQTRNSFLHRDQAARLLRAVKGTRLAAFVAVGIYAGLRLGETVNLRPGRDVKLEDGIITIQSRKGEYAWRTKNGKARDIPMSRALRRWITRHVRDGFAGERYLFRPHDSDRPINRTTGIRWTQEAFLAGGIKYGGRSGDALSNHSLRHTFGTWLAMHGLSPIVIAELMGDTVPVVIRTYLHHYPGEKQRAVERMRRQPQ